MGLLITIAVLAILFLIALKLFTVKRVVVEGNERPKDYRGCGA